ncbi:septum formation inhibitor Maf [Microlunatus elymi]|uniref:Nucleoside triphosphate pyrophosphatase n=1 Tax=Microlunatus elymi TaxID=2596828 RepID=A0A516PWZ6_9ACTN|nr:Maf family protein [Microlunatus elymi]QDP95706.1 septum formation inhibitor Maf [Microlunatus elymi]
MSELRLVLASQSPARLATLRSAGVEPEVIVSGVDESVINDADPAGLALALAQLKARAVADQLVNADDTDDGVDDRTILVIGCDSVLELDGAAYGKPHDPQVAIQRWQQMRGRSGVLHTGHQVIKINNGEITHAAGRGAATIVHFADLDDAEIKAYVDTGEPLVVAGSFTLDGLGGPFVTGIEGDPHNVIGISLPLLREMIMAAGHSWPELWASVRP